MAMNKAYVVTIGYENEVMAVFTKKADATKYARKYREENRERLLVKCRKYYAENRETVRARQRLYRERKAA